jgi:hypothetical protein
MLKLLFGRSSVLVTIMDLLGLTGLATTIVVWSQNPYWNFTVILFTIFCVLHFFIRVCYLIHWYPQEGRDIGIEVHFKRCLVPANYLVPVVLLSFLVGWEIFFLIIGNIFFTLVTLVNIFMIGFYFKDKSNFPVNSLSLKPYDQIAHPQEYTP